MTETEILIELDKRKNEIIMTVEVGDKSVPELQKKLENYDFFSLIEHKPGKFRWFNSKTGISPGLNGKTTVEAISNMIMTNFSISYACPGDIYFSKF